MLGLCLDILSRCVPRINLKQFFLENEDTDRIEDRDRMH